MTTKDEPQIERDRFEADLAAWTAGRAWGDQHNGALWRLANWLVRILHGCLKTRTLCDEDMIPTTQLPFGQHVNSVIAGPAGVQITVSGGQTWA